MMMLISLMLICNLALLSDAASAPPPPNPFVYDGTAPGPGGSKKDGYLDGPEFLMFTASMFDRMDADKSTTIIAREWIGPCDAFKQIAKRDSKGVLSVTRNDFQDASKMQFKVIDKLSLSMQCGGDGLITPDEYRSFGPPLPDPCIPPPPPCVA